MAASISISVISFMLLSSSVTAINFQVGGGDGWVVNPSESYDHWAQRLRFRVNDSLVFKYKEGEDTVVEVTKADYDECDVSNPVRTMRSGSSVVRFDRSGPFYFVSGKKKNCVGGQKLVVVVLAVRPAIRAPPSSSPSPVPSIPPKSQAPSPSPVPSVPPKSQAPSPGGDAPEFAPRPSAAAPTPSPISATPASSPSPISATPASSPSPISVTPTPSPAPISYTPASSPSPISSPASSPSPISATPTPSPAPFSYTPASSPSPVSSAPSLAPNPSGASSPGNSPAGAPVASPAPAPPGEQNSPPAADQISPADSSNTTSPGSSTAWRGISGISPAALIVVGVAGLLTFVM
ncbi:Early nodulin-like protein 2 [Linum perenne]